MKTSAIAKTAQAVAQALDGKLSRRSVQSILRRRLYRLIV